MRQIKFRAWDAEHKRYLYPDLEHPRTGYVLDSKTGKAAYAHIRCGTDPIGVQMTLAGEVFSACHYATANYAGYPLEQFIGMQDKNGKEIYEGDILNGFNQRFVIEYGIARRSVGQDSYEIDIPCFYFRNIYTNAKVFPIVKNVVGGHDLETLEVVGNIYEHPDLLIA